MNNRDTINPVHLAHHWFMSRRGGERTVEEIARLFPSAAISTLFLDRRTLPADFAARSFVVSPLGRLAPRLCGHRRLLPFFPWAVRQLAAPVGTKLLVSSDAAVIKGMRRPADCVHVCYCHSPPRYLWDMSGDYARQTAGLGPIGRWVFENTVSRLQEFDRAAAAGVDHFIANSGFVAERIRRSYGREAVVLAPPVEVERFKPSSRTGDFYLVVSELVSYKRVDLAVAACTQTGRRLVVVGDGPEMHRLRTDAGASVQFRGRVSDNEVAVLMAECRALLHPQIEDFGITAVEVQAAGRPVIAFRGGGAVETVVENETGIFFDEQTPESLAAVLHKFEACAAEFSAGNCRRQAERFAPDIFRRELSRRLKQFMPESQPWW